MRLGATIHRYCGVRITDPDAYIAECRKQGFRAATCPDHHLGGSDRIREIRDAFGRADIVIAEIGGWANCLDPRAEHRREAINTVAEALATTDELGALCCINVAGSFDIEKMYAPHPDNFSPEAFDGVVQWVTRVLREVKPTRAKLTIESSPWTPIDGPEAYQILLQAIDHPGFAVHLDPVNFVCDNRTYFDTTAMLNQVFDRFGPRTVSCHAKDIRQGDPKTVELSEVLPGQGVLDYKTFLTRLGQLPGEVPLIIEHLKTEQEYTDAASYIRSVAEALPSDTVPSQ
jgi:sugar phosphate isomerase/epimerase